MPDQAFSESFLGLPTDKINPSAAFMLDHTSLSGFSTSFSFSWPKGPLIRAIKIWGKSLPIY